LRKRNLSILLPFTFDVSVRDLIKIRSREIDAFVRYRAALNALIDEFCSKKGGLIDKNARELYSDTIAPRLSELDQKFKQARRDLVAKPFRTAVSVVGALSFGIYSGLLGAQVAEVAKALGLGKIVFDFLEKAMAFGDAQASLKADNLYFLWRTKRRVRQ
jgi:hypothetical protein